MATKNQIKAHMRKKRRRGELSPQVCPNPTCGADLRDRTIPDEYSLYAEMFTAARELPIDTQNAVWMCPVCGHTFNKHPWTGTKEEAERMLRGDGR